MAQVEQDDKPGDQAKSRTWCLTCRVGMYALLTAIYRVLMKTGGRFVWVVARGRCNAECSLTISRHKQARPAWLQDWEDYGTATFSICSDWITSGEYEWTARDDADCLSLA